MEKYDSITGDVIWGEHIVPLLYCTNSQQIYDALLGCDFEKPLEPRIMISQCHPLGRWVTGFDENHQQHGFALSDGLVYASDVLHQALIGHYFWETSEAAIYENLRMSALEQFGFGVNLHEHHREFLYEAIAETQEHRLPPVPIRQKALELAHCPYRPHAIVSFAQAWIKAAAPEILPHELAAMARALRSLGRSQDAVNCTQIMEQSRSYELSPLHQGILLTIRASAMLDLVEQHRCTQIYANAVECIERAKSHLMRYQPCPQFEDVWRVRKRILAMRKIFSE